MDGAPRAGVVARNDGKDGINEALIVIRLAWRGFQLTHHRETAGNEFEHLIECRDWLARPGIGRLQRGEREGTDRTTKIGGAVDGFVVHEDGDAVGAELDVDLHRIGMCIDACADASKCVRGGFAGGAGVTNYEWMRHVG